jgi:hypothetical protein
MKHVVRALLACLLIATVLGAAAPAQAHAESYAEWAIRVWSVRYGLDPDYMVNVAYCESNLDPAAYNPSSGATGIFQFTWDTYYWLRDDGLNQDPTYVPGDFFETRDISSIAAQAHVATWAFAHGWGYLWDCA